jgi:hypothetical protein
VLLLRHIRCHLRLLLLLLLLLLLVMHSPCAGEPNVFRAPRARPSSGAAPPALRANKRPTRCA